jgi:hypothetical protein
MVRSNATTVEQYLEELPKERRAVISAVREVILKNLPEGYAESVNWGLISYEVPLERYPKTYNKQPLSFAALAAQKNYYALYLTCICVGGETSFREEFAKAGKKLDMGKSCVRFRKLDDLPLDVIGRVIAASPPDKFIARFEELHQQRGQC